MRVLRHLTVASAVSVLMIGSVLAQTPPAEAGAPAAVARDVAVPV